jgi:type VI secretion system secreted protein Hcp
MALNAYLRLKGQKSGEIKGAAVQRGRVGSIAVIAFDHQIVSPRDIQSGLPTGQRMHKPLVITKEVDGSSPVLWNILCTNENIVEWELRFWQLTATGSESQYFTIRLVNANIAAIHLQMPDNKLAASAALKEREEISFTYQKISWTYETGSITAQDDWEARV